MGCSAIVAQRFLIHDCAIVSCLTTASVLLLANVFFTKDETG